MIGLLNLLGGTQGLVSVLAFLGLLLGCGTAGLILLRRTRRPVRTSWVLSGLAAAAALALTLWPDSGRSATGCSIEFSTTAPTDVQSLANIALLIPATFFATIASRHPVAVLAAGSGLSAAIELTQDLIPALDRACTTQDWQMNTIGGVLGTAIAWWTLWLAARHTPLIRRDGRGRKRRVITWAWTGAAAFAIATWFAAAALDPIPSDPCDEAPAGAATALPGGVDVRAGSQTGHLCIDGPDGDEAGLGADPAPGVLQTYGSGTSRWSIGVVPAGTLTAHDDRGASARTHAVRGTRFRVWSTYTNASRSVSVPAAG